MPIVIVYTQHMLIHICVHDQTRATVLSPSPMSLCHGQGLWTLAFSKPFQVTAQGLLCQELPESSLKGFQDPWVKSI